jgi:hypothetical protein
LRLGLHDAFRIESSRRRIALLDGDDEGTGRARDHTSAASE